MSETTTIEQAERERRDMAVAIARDVIAQVRAGDSYRIEMGVYLDIVHDDETIPGSADLREHFAAFAPKCSVCMLGAAFLSLARIDGRVPVDAVREWNQEEVFGRLREVFGRHPLGLMECAFECNPWFGDARPQDRGAAVFGLRYGGDGLRAVAIAENIIAHDGLFVVPDATWGEYDEVRDDDYDDDAARDYDDD